MGFTRCTQACIGVAALLSMLVAHHMHKYEWYPHTRLFPAPIWSWDEQQQLRDPAVPVELPASTSEVVDLVARVRQAHGALKVIGAGHSWSAAAVATAPGCVPVSLDKLAGIRSFNESSGEVTVAAGTRLSELYAYLAGRGRSLHNMPSVADQSVGGALATNTHGSGAAFPPMAEHVTAVELVTGQPEVVHVSEDGPLAHLLPAVRISLGGWITTAVTLRTVPAFNVTAHEQLMATSDFLQHLPAYIVGGPHDHSKAWMTG